MPKLSPEAMRQRRQNIVDAAIRQFEKHGFGGASVDEICAEAGISKGALYTHFASKEAIMLEWIRQRGMVYDAIAVASLAELEEIVFDLFLRNLSHIDARFEMEAVMLAASNDAIKQALNANTDICRARIREAIEQLRAAGMVEMVDDITPEEAMDLILTYAQGRLARQAFETANLDDEARRGLVVTMRGLVRALQ